MIDWLKNNWSKILLAILTAIAGWLGWDKYKPQPPPDPGPALVLPDRIEVKDGGLCAVPASGRATRIHWTVHSCSPGVEYERVHEDATILKLICRGDGQLKVIAYAVWENDVVVAECTIVVHGARPPPIPPKPEPPKPDPPKPDPPKPDPPKPPVTTPLWVVVVEETADAASNRGSFFSNEELWALMKAKGHKWRVFDKDVRDKDGNTPKDLEEYLNRASGKKLPYLFLVDSSSTVHREGPLPSTPAGLVQLLKEVGR